MDLKDEKFIEVILRSVEAGNEEGKLKIMKINLKNEVVAEGNNYSSEIVKLNLEYNTKKGEKKNQNLILKLYLSSRNYKLMKEFGLYEKELNMYKSVLPAMEEILKKTGEDLIFPKAFESIYPEILVLEDLTVSGYVMMDRMKQLNFEHAAIAFKTMGKFHALSIRLNEKSPKIIDKVKGDIYLNGEVNHKFFIELYESSFDQILKELSQIEATRKYIDSFKGLKTQVLHKVEKLLKTPNKMQLLNHGDYWLNNMMFKHDDEGNVVDSKLIDFQVCRWCSPGAEIWYFVITSVAFSVFELHFDSLIAVYVQRVNSILEKAGSTSRFTFEDLKEEINDAVAFGIYIMIAILPIIIADPSNPLDMAKLGDELNNLNLEIFSNSCKNEPFLKIVSKWFLYFNERMIENGVKF